MSDSKYKDKYRIPSARAAWHDYDGGSYFITICTKYREHDFGEIEDGKMLLSEIGTHTQKCIEEITQHNPYAEIPLHVIMPNHLHLIVVIDYDKTPHDKRTVDVVATPVETFPETSHNKTMVKETFPETSHNKTMTKGNGNAIVVIRCHSSIQTIHHPLRPRKQHRFRMANSFPRSYHSQQ